jgi:hypothetical protein
VSPVGIHGRFRNLADTVGDDAPHQRPGGALRNIREPLSDLPRWRLPCPQPPRPAVLRAVPTARAAVEDWTRRCARIDHMLRGDRARLIEGLPWSVRTAWQVSGARRYRAAVVRLRGAPPAA